VTIPNPAGPEVADGKDFLEAAIMNFFIFIFFFFFLPKGV
jgi:hypothetical protein